MKRGFTLVEIMIVVAIIALLAAIAIPNLLRARVTANDASAQATLRTISTAFETYAAANGGNYPTGDAALTGGTPPYINRAYSGSTVQGFVYTYATANATNYLVQATPASGGTTGTRGFAICSGGVLNQTAQGTYTAPSCP